ncbi:hypothetical protein FISHEDRAFT_75796 [Fistulina hepatica ATCC 64428]|uniref:Uncharacterized protein n=1 Tax=Fistulina hepatica ATCC 64428 TaxID=1128425 RepID=A0A0D7A695_9AGAR|nr:hypothetical protein FISHEDRAFT_75796 [Fistulina hepatica ATCC 64428]
MSRATWENPNGTLTIILLILGGDIVHKALAQLSGSYVVPVAFSCGWIGYSFNTLMSVVGDGRLMPPPDYDAKLINGANGFVRDNRSWVLGRLLRDFERPLDDDVALCVTVFKASASSKAGVPDIDWYWRSGVVTIILQLIIAAIPCVREDDWSILLITGIGAALALLTGALPQWRFEKWACRRNTNKTLCLTGGNGTRNVMVIIGGGVGLDLEDLAAAESPRLLRRNKRDTTRILMDLPLAFRITLVSCVALSVLWIIFLIAVTSLKQNTWFFLLVGGLGMAQNVVVAGSRRRPGTSGIHLEKVEEFRRRKVMHALMDVELKYPRTGKSIVREFFPNESGLSASETQWWEGKREEHDRARAKQQSTHSGKVTPEKPHALTQPLHVEASPSNSPVIPPVMEDPHSNSPVSPPVIEVPQSYSPIGPPIVEVPETHEK